ncbi:MAG: hypothetical protein KBT39_11335 [Bacteroidales bacterium]|nr:hypothetical protein [Bacteroidales bacterium]
MKKVINAILFLCACALAWICVGSIVDDQEVDAQIDARKKVVIARLLDIKKAQEAYKELHDTTLIYYDEEGATDGAEPEMKTANFGCYAESFDILIDFLKTARYPEKIVKEGYIQEGAQRKGWTDAKVANHIWQLRQSGMSDDAIREQLKGEDLPGVWCDTIWAENPIQTILGRADYPVDSLRYIPFSDEEDGQLKEFEMRADVHFKMKVPMYYAMQCEAHYNTFLSKEKGTANNKRKNLVQYEEERGNFPGLKIGDLTNWNNNAGNWE